MKQEERKFKSGQLELFERAVPDSNPALDSPCLDCGLATTPHWRGRPVGCWELYMVHDRVWKRAGMAPGCLCIGCLEARLGRSLGPRDFTSALINRPNSLDTVRLRARKGQDVGAG